MTIKHPFTDGHEKAPDEDVLLASRNLDILVNALPKRHLPFGVVDVELKLGVSPKVARDRFI